MSDTIIDLQRAVNDPEYCQAHFNKLVEKIAERSEDIANVVFSGAETAGEQVVLAGCLLKMVKAKLAAVSQMVYQRIATAEKEGVGDLIQTIEDLRIMDEGLESLYSCTFSVGRRFNPHGLKFHEKAMDACFVTMLKSMTEKAAEKSA